MLIKTKTVKHMNLSGNTDTRVNPYYYYLSHLKYMRPISHISHMRLLGTDGYWRTVFWEGPVHTTGHGTGVSGQSRNVPRSTGTYLCALIDWGVGRLCSHGTRSQGLTLCPPWIRGGEIPHGNPVGQQVNPFGCATYPKVRTKHEIISLSIVSPIPV